VIVLRSEGHDVTIMSLDDMIGVMKGRGLIEYGGNVRKEDGCGVKRKDVGGGMTSIGAGMSVGMSGTGMSADMIGTEDIDR
jgi:hypothetical protein